MGSPPTGAAPCSNLLAPLAISTAIRIIKHLDFALAREQSSFRSPQVLPWALFHRLGWRIITRTGKTAAAGTTAACNRANHAAQNSCFHFCGSGSVHCAFFVLLAHSSATVAAGAHKGGFHLVAISGFSDSLRSPQHVEGSPTGLRKFACLCETKEGISKE